MFTTNRLKLRNLAFLVLVIFCSLFFLNASDASGSESTISLKGVGLMLFVLGCYELGDTFSPISEWEQEIKDLKDSASVIKKKMLKTSINHDQYSKLGNDLRDIQKEKREKQKKLSRFKSWFYPVVGVVTTGVVVAGAWLLGGLDK